MVSQYLASFYVSYIFAEKVKITFSSDALAYSSPRMGMYRIKPIEQLVPVSFTYRYASTPGLSTS